MTSTRDARPATACVAPQPDGSNEARGSRAWVRPVPGPRWHPVVWLVLAIVPGIVLAQSTGGAYRIRKQVIAAGVEASGGTYRLVGTVGQAVAGPQGGGSYRVSGGFHFAQGAGTSGSTLFCDGFEDSPCP
jgi:hypothetical protein